MDFRNFLVLLAFFINFFLSLLIFYRSAKTNANRAFIVTAFGITLWCFAMFLYRTADASTVILWTRTLYFFPTFIPTSFLFFGLYFPQYKVSKKIWSFIIGINILMAVLTLFTNTVIRNVIIPVNTEKIIIFGWAYYWMYILYIPGFFTASYIVFFRKYLKERPFIRMQILYILAGMTAASMPAMVTNLNLPTFGYFELNWVGQLFTIFWISGVAYAVIKHRLMDIKLIAARAVTYTILILLISLGYSLSFFLIGSSLLSLQLSPTLLLFYGVIIIIVAFTFQPLKNIITTLTDEIFYRGSYDPQELLKAFSLIMSSTIKLDALTLNILEKLMLDMKATRGAFVLFSEKEDQVIEYIEQKGYKNVPTFTAKEIHTFFENKKLVILDELEEGSLKDLMRKLNAIVALQLNVNERRVGVLLLGEKASGDIYSQQDISVFEILAPQLSVAIENSREYEEIKRFNVTLSEEIDKATKELQAANDKLQQLDTLKDEFVSLASHELRTPMTAIKSYLWMALAGKGGELSEKQKYYLDRAYNSTDRLIKLVNDMLNVSRIESGRITLYTREVELNTLIQDVIAELAPRAEELGLVLKSIPATDLPKVSADADKIKEVLINLIGNSFKFTPKGGTITVFCKEENNMVLISVSDTGAGLSTEDMQKLFQKFGKVGGNYLQKQNTQGTGLGLYLSKSIVELHKGTMWAESEGLGKGATFTFNLPKLPS